MNKFQRLNKVLNEADYKFIAEIIINEINQEITKSDN